MTAQADDDGYPHDDDRQQIEIVLPSARSIVWLGLKIYVLVVLGVLSFAIVAGLLAIVVVAVMR